MNKDKIGGELSERQNNYLLELREYTGNCVKATIGANDADYEDKITQAFGKDVCGTGQHEDQDLLAQDALLYYRDALAQKMRKLSFRKGLAYRWRFTDEGHKVPASEGGRTLYDTKEFKDAHHSEYFGSIYVMNAKGNIYVQGWEEERKQLKHSSLLAGSVVLCAGTIRINGGKVLWLTGKSGHYKPSVVNVVCLLEKLSQ